MEAKLRTWSGIESEELGDNWIQVAFRHDQNNTRVYRVFGKLDGETFDEHYDSEYDDNKRLAYSLYWDKLEQF